MKTSAIITLIIFSENYDDLISSLILSLISSPSSKVELFTLQIDISGKCPVVYTRSSNGYSVDTISKIKDMIGCVDGHDSDTIFHGIPYTVDSVSLPLSFVTAEANVILTVNATKDKDHLIYLLFNVNHLLHRKLILRLYNILS